VDEERKMTERTTKTLEQVIATLNQHSRPDQLAGMKRYGMSVENRLGLSIPFLRKFAREIGKDHNLALKLWGTGITEARILAALVDNPELLTERQMEDWVKDINSWDVCDQLCMNLFEKSTLAWKKIKEWSERPEEFVKRAAFSLIACLAWHDKKSDDKPFLEALPMIIEASSDERNYVKKSVNWALRNIGKRKARMNRTVIETALLMRHLDSRMARWIANDAIRELESEAVKKRLDKS
jgi:3-methyladenine DNA glycosylase AlkD